MKSVALYARVSTEQQTQRSTIDSQLEALKAQAEADGHVVLPNDIYADDGYSGATLIRPALELLRDRVAQGGLELLYIHSPDRLARRYAYQVLILEEFANQGVQVQFIHGPKGQSPEDELLVQVQGMIAEYERAKIIERHRRGKLHQARQGSVNVLSAAPYGYLYVSKTSEEPARYEVLLHEARVVRQIFEGFVYEQKSIGQIKRELDGQVPTRTGKSYWDRGTLWGLLGNPAYMGKAAFGKTEAVQASKLLRPVRGRATIPRRPKSSYRKKPKEQWIYIDVPAIIPAELFEAAALQLERNQRLSARNNRGNRYLLQGLTVCAMCGYAYYGKTVSRKSAKGKQRWGYYRCVGTDAYRFGGTRVCVNKQVRVGQLDEYVWQSLRELLENPERVRDEWSRRNATDGVLVELRQQHQEATRQVSAQERTLKRLLDAYEAEVLTLAELSERSARVRSRLERAGRQLEESENQLSKTVEISALVSRLEEFAQRVSGQLDELGWEEKRQLIRTLVSRVEIDEQGATIVYRLPRGPGGGSGRVDPVSVPADEGAEPSEEKSLHLGRRRSQPTAGQHLHASGF
jgi:site-specific DNA recombinase